MRKPPHTTRATRQSIIRAMAPPDKIPLPPRNWKVMGNIWPSRQNRPAQYLLRVTSSGEMEWAIHMAKSTATTAFTASERMTTRVRGPPKVR